MIGILFFFSIRNQISFDELLHNMVVVMVVYCCQNKFSFPLIRFNLFLYIVPLIVGNGKYFFFNIHSGMNLGEEKKSSIVRR